MSTDSNTENTELWLTVRYDDNGIYVLLRTGFTTETEARATIAGFRQNHKHNYEAYPYTRATYRQVLTDLKIFE